MIMCREQYGKAIDKAIFPGTQGGPLMHVIAGKAVCFGEALKPEFKDYQAQIIKNAKALEAAFRAEGIKMVSDGTDNHLLLLDFSGTEMTGKLLETLLEEANITVNKNTVPNETRSPFVTSGVRVGTPAVTSPRLQGSGHGEGRKVDCARRSGRGKCCAFGEGGGGSVHEGVPAV